MKSIVDGFEIGKSIFFVVALDLGVSRHALGNFWEETIVLRDVPLSALGSP